MLVDALLGYDHGQAQGQVDMLGMRSLIPCTGHEASHLEFHSAVAYPA